MSDTKPDDFRRYLRQFLVENIPAELKAAQDFQSRLQVDQILARDNLLAITWPTRLGGRGEGARVANIVDEERALAGIPIAKSPSRFGISLLGAALAKHGDETQLAKHAPHVLAATRTWCQGFSEPGAGSDLAAVTTRARRDDGAILLNGAKTWTTQAHEADWCFALVRTGPASARHRNLSMVFVDLRQPGVTIRPIRMLNGTTEFNEVFFDDAVVQPEDVLGGWDNGWAVAMTMLGAERSYGLASRYNSYAQELQEVVATFASASPHEKESVGRLDARLFAIKALGEAMQQLEEQEQDLGVLPSVAKLWWSETHQEVLSFATALETEHRPSETRWSDHWLLARAETIYAGTSQVQRNIISRRGLGLPT